MRSLSVSPAQAEDRRLLEALELERRKKESRMRRLAGAPQSQTREAKAVVRGGGLQKFSLRRRPSRVRSRSKVSYLSQKHDLLLEEEEPSDSLPGGADAEQLEDSLAGKFSLKLFCFNSWKRLRLRSGDALVFYGRFLFSCEQSCVAGLLGIDRVLNSMRFSESLADLEEPPWESFRLRVAPLADLNFLALAPSV